MPRRTIVVVGASAGGVEALQRLVAGLPENFPATVLVVLHQGAASPNMLPSILRRRSHLPVLEAHSGLQIRPSTVVVAAPDFHLVVDRGAVRVAAGPKANRHRPAVDILFRSAALAYGPQVIGVVLTGLRDDGALGVVSIKEQGGVVVVQDPSDAMYPSMPESAIEADSPEAVIPLREIPAKLEELVSEKVSLRRPVGRSAAVSRQNDKVIVMESKRNGKKKSEEIPDLNPTAFVCPECSGTLFLQTTGKVDNFVCRVGHSYSLDALSDAKREALEAAMWIAIRTLEESSALAQRMAEKSETFKHHLAARRWRALAQTRQHDANVIRDVLGRDTENIVNE